MSEILLTENDDCVESAPEPVSRLCSEIQLFDLCDLDKCRYKRSNFCTDEELLTSFEKIADEDASSRISLSDSDLEDDDELSGYGFDDEDGSDDFEAEEDM